MKFNLLEAKSVGILYHFTDNIGLNRILATNSLRDKYPSIRFHAVSKFTAIKFQDKYILNGTE